MISECHVKVNREGPDHLSKKDVVEKPGISGNLRDLR